MVYSFKEYKAMFETPMKRQQELAIARKIMNLLNNNKYDDLEMFVAKNIKYQDFLKNNNMQTVVKHFGNTLTEEDYIKILENLRKLTMTKHDFEKDNIKTTNIDNKEFNSFKGQDKTYYIDNSSSSKSIEDQMKELQPTQQDFQTDDINKNTENLFRELEQKKEGLNLVPLIKINYNNLNSEQMQLYQEALLYQKDKNTIIKADLAKSIIVDEEGNIMRLSKEDGKIKIMKDENGVEKEETPTFQKQLTPSMNTIYSN